MLHSTYIPLPAISTSKDGAEEYVRCFLSRRPAGYVLVANDAKEVSCGFPCLLESLRCTYILDVLLEYTTQISLSQIVSQSKARGRAKFPEPLM